MHGCSTQPPAAYENKLIFYYLPVPCLHRNSYDAQSASPLTRVDTFTCWTNPESQSLIGCGWLDLLDCCRCHQPDTPAPGTGACCMAQSPPLAARHYPLRLPATPALVSLDSVWIAHPRYPRPRPWCALRGRVMMQTAPARPNPHTRAGRGAKPGPARSELRPPALWAAPAPCLGRHGDS